MMVIHDLIVIRSGGMPLYTRQVDEMSLLKSGFYKAIYDFGKQQDSCLSRIEFLNGTCAYCHYFEEKDLLFFTTVGSYYFKEGIILKMKRLYNEIFKDLDTPKTGDIIRDETIIKKVEGILFDKMIKKQILKNQDKIKKVCNEILQNREIKAISIHFFDNTPIFFVGCEFDTIKEWLLNWNLANPPAPFEFGFGNYLDKKSLQGIIMNSGISFGTDNYFILYYIFGESANLGYYMDELYSKLNKIIG